MINPEIASHIRKDPYANWLGATIETIEPGYSRVSLVVSESMLSFHGMGHGGLVFSLGDIAFAAASNSHGQTALALNVAVNFLRATALGDHLVAEATEVRLGGATALYDIVVTEKIVNSWSPKVRPRSILSAKPLSELEQGPGL
ncbi:hotdog fold thioesterase [Desulfobulbus sp.]|uniref:hotdog fold thioesterase n=1 Tax=Desulfobulbus sp. TaxID=895 RepID=UPI0027B97522|nr:hotdog fold thioesterase [Desulfobulbus sp.]